MAHDKVTPEAVDNARKAFQRHWDKTRKELPYIALRDALGGVGSNSLVKDLRKQFAAECEAADEVKNFISAESMIVFHAALGTVHRDLRRDASLKLTACEQAKEEAEARHKEEVADYTARLDSLEIEHHELKEKHAALQDEHEALRALEREQHASVAELKAANVLLSKRVVEQSRTLSHLLDPEKPSPSRLDAPKSAAPKSRAARKPPAKSKPKSSRGAGAT